MAEMRRLFEIDLKDYDGCTKVFRRPSVRGIIFKKNKIAMVYATNEKYYKFPGGGMHEDEDKKEALLREVKEEVGLSVIPESITEFGSVLRRQKSDLDPDTVFEQENFYFLCETEDEPGEQNLDDYEAEAGFELSYVDIDEAIKVNGEYRSGNFFNEVMIDRERRVLELIRAQRNKTGMTKILVIEDDKDINKILCGLLRKNGYEVESAMDGATAIPLIKKDPDLILMDLMLPDTTGEELLSKVSEGIPVIAVSARSQVTDKVDLLTRGCVDYITKPFDDTELLARLEVALRFKKKPSRFSIGNLTLEESDHVIKVNAETVKFTPTEYAIMKALIRNQDRVVSRSELIELAREDTSDLVEDSLKVHLSNLRRKLKTAGSNVEVEAVWGIGFKLSVN